ALPLLATVRLHVRAAPPPPAAAAEDAGHSRHLRRGTPEDLVAAERAQIPGLWGIK
ncbi:unnamed protein product, partial [Prorocentrum cordatum]